jgi:hypothetical protein
VIVIREEREPATPPEAQPVVARMIEVPSPKGARPKSISPAAVVVLRDGSRVTEVERYTIMNNILYDYTNPRRARKIPLDAIDLDATIRLNKQRGVEFRIPPGPNEIEVRL